MIESNTKEHRISASVIGCLRPGWIKLRVGDGIGLLDGGIDVEVPVHLVPHHLRMPNSRLVLVTRVSDPDFVGVEELRE